MAPRETGRRMENTAIGFVGFGEAGSRIARGLRESGAGALFAFDVHADTPGRGSIIRSRALDAEVGIVSSNEELAKRVQVILAVTTASSAVEAAHQNAPHLEAGRHI